MGKYGCEFFFVVWNHWHGKLTFYTSVGTAVEHHVLYQYQFVETKAIFMGQIQTETP